MIDGSHVVVVPTERHRAGDVLALPRFRCPTPHVPSLAGAEDTAYFGEVHLDEEETFNSRKSEQSATESIEFEARLHSVYSGFVQLANHSAAAVQAFVEKAWEA